MKCPIKKIECQKYKSYNITDINKKEIETFNICEDCISEIDTYKVQSKKELTALSCAGLVCSFCKMTLEDLMKKSRMGCAKCYEIFEQQLDMAIDKIQKNITNKKLTHVGKIPSNWIKDQIKQINPKEFLKDLRNEQKISIMQEKYELANELKGKIIGFEFLLDQYNIFKSEPEQCELIENQIYEFMFLHKMKLKE